jgi:hypothetical protein
MGKWENGKMRRWEDEKMGRWEDEKMRRWEVVMQRIVMGQALETRHALYSCFTENG